jgi:glycosyltransferase involved in cell wall biosynthesis
MKILIINSRFFLSAGPEKYMFGLIELLEKHGHEVIPFSTRHKENRKTPYAKYFVDPIGGENSVYYKDYELEPRTVYRMLERQFYSFHVKKRLEKLIKDTKPDIAYILHHANKLGPSVVDACKKYRLPVVMRLSDFTLVCPNEHLYRDNGVCEECIEHSLFRAVRHRCVKGSLPQSLVKAVAMSFHRFMRIYQKVDRVVSPSKFTITRVQGTIDPKKLVHIPTFIIRTAEYNPEVGDYMLYVGRIEEHKGILDAIQAVEKTRQRFIIVGGSSTGYDQVLKTYVKEHDLSNIEFTGAKFGEELLELYRNARFVVIPTIWYENMPNVALEAMMYSKPIIAPAIGSMTDIVRDGHNGLIYNPGDLTALRYNVARLFRDKNLCQKLGKGSYNEATTTYDPETHYTRLMNVFRQVIR